ncbi:MAG: hypothetical protein K9J16_17755 [Melioribacteraceae bacterium]|nr:hypothetical protein [Melioribacteraceae bacterium]MCF8356730.1 hypothetical protein [Melioribacteraceae bacterium]MCF8396084.1 hypothetical protein [Melioribacteraceae bacterium]MCF8421070.1 hypothetical protein [Melioribacteraceae bacterium]
MKNHLMLTINSAILYSIAFALVFFLNELGLIFAGVIGGLEPVLYHNTMTFTNITDTSQLIYFAGGPAASLISGIAGYFIYRNLSHDNDVLKLFFLWFYIHGLTLFLTQVPNLPFDMSSDLGKAVAVLDINQTVLIIIAITGLFFLITLGFSTAKEFMCFADHDSVVEDKTKRQDFIFYAAIAPWWLGALISMPFRLPPFEWIYTILPVSNGLAVIWSMIAVGKTKLTADDLKGYTNNLSVYAIGVYIFLLLVFQFLLRSGINFGS